VKSTLDDVIRDITAEQGAPPLLVATGAAAAATVTYSGLREQLRKSKQPFLLLFGTGWGLTEEVMERADVVLTPVKGPGEYNHLSVRSAVAIILDRLMGQ
jgi:hypothetical protein